VLTSCTDEDLRALYSTWHVFAFPSLYEGYGIRLLEAMQGEAPVVATDIPTSRATPYRCSWSKSTAIALKSCSSKERN
jgi:hypothetical protein